MGYRKLTPKDREWLLKFDKVVNGRASKAECNELGVSPKLRRELYTARDRRRLDATYKPERRRPLIENQVGLNPIDALIEVTDRRYELDFPLYEGEGREPRMPAKRKPRVARLTKRSCPKI